MPLKKRKERHVSSRLDPDERHPRKAERPFLQRVQTHVSAVELAEPREESVLAFWQHRLEIRDILGRVGERIQERRYLAET